MSAVFVRAGFRGIASLLEYAEHSDRFLGWGAFALAASLRLAQIWLAPVQVWELRYRVFRFKLRNEKFFSATIALNPHASL